MPDFVLDDLLSLSYLILMKKITVFFHTKKLRLESLLLACWPIVELLKLVIGGFETQTQDCLQKLCFLLL